MTRFLCGVLAAEERSQGLPGRAQGALESRKAHADLKINTFGAELQKEE